MWMVSLGCLEPETGLAWTIDSGYQSEHDAWERAAELMEDGYVAIQLFYDGQKVYDEAAVSERLRGPQPYIGDDAPSEGDSPRQS